VLHLLFTVCQIIKHLIFMTACMSTSLKKFSKSGEVPAAVLSLIAGYIDAYSYITYGTYVSFMSGNTTQTGTLIAQGNISSGIPAMLALGFFVTGVFAGTLLTYQNTRKSQRLLIAVVAALLLVFIIVTQIASLKSWEAHSRIGLQSVSIGFITGTLCTVAQHLALAVKHVPLENAQGSRDSHNRRAYLLMSIWIAFITGALLSGALTASFGVWVLLFPLLVLLGLVVYTGRC
jgi:uncharacterized membrane protein YoaK (UPF0700 family)